jgi:CHAD domain-containing protein
LTSSEIARASLLETASFMAIALERTKLVFRKMDRELRRLSSGHEPEAVHDFRTTTRRLEILLRRLTSGNDRNQKKLLKMLACIRKRAGKVRDLDVQLAALRNLKVPQEPRRKTQLMQRLVELRLQHERKLHKLLKKDGIREIRKRLKRAMASLQLDATLDPQTVAQDILSSVSPSSGQVSDSLLHQYRMAVKQARYAAEFAPRSAASTKFMAELKHLQDALGHWHDWLTLTQTATEHLGEVGQSSLVAVLHNVTRGKYRQAVTALEALPRTLDLVERANTLPRRSSQPATPSQSPSSESKTAA